MMLTKITLSLLIIKAINCENNLSDNFYTQKTYSGTTECVKSVIQKYFPCGSFVTLVNSKKDSQLIQSLNSANDCYSFIVRSYDDYDWFISNSLYVINAGNVADVLKGVLEIVNDIFWNPRSRIIIELETLEEREEIDTIFHILMNHKAYDVVLIRGNSGIVVIDTYYPFKDNNCGKKVEVVTIDCKDLAHSDLFRDKNISLRNCTIQVAATQDIPNFIFESSHLIENGKPLLGLEQLVLETIAETEGLHLSYMLVDREHNFGVILPNHTATGLLGILQRYDIDIAAGGLVLMKNRVNLFDFIWGYHYAAFNVFTPAIGEEIWKDIYKAFSGETWALILIAYCLVAVISTMKRRVLLRSQNQMCISLKLWGYFFINTSSKLSKEKMFRVMMVFWIWFTFFVSNFYNTELYSLLTGRTQITRHMSAERLGELPYEPCISESTRTYYFFAYNQSLPEGRNIPECKYATTALDYVAMQRNTYAIEIEYIYKLHKYKYITKNGIHILDTWTFSINNPISMYLARGFLLRDKFQYYALRIYESGILEKNLDQIYRLQNHGLQPQPKIHFEKMLLSDLRIHFYILLLGSALSFLCFICEILWFRYSKTVKAKWWKLFYKISYSYHD